MKKAFKPILLILFIVILGIAMISCTESEELPPISEDEGNTSPVMSVNKKELMTKISEGMTEATLNLEEADKKYVKTTYSIVTGYINYTITYIANYATKHQESEIYLKVFDNNEHINRIFIYYNQGDIFIQAEGKKQTISGFGSTSSFDLFYEMVIMFDLSGTFISDEMSTLFDPDNIGTSISSLIDQERLSYIKVSDTAESIEMTAVNLNYGQIKLVVNKKIKDTFSKFEKKFDLLSLKYLGLRISDLAILEIATMTGDLINIRLNDAAVETVIMSASGDMADGINTFKLDIEITAKTGEDTIEIDDSENPYLDDYPEMLMGRFNYGGTLYVPFFDMTYDATLRTILSSTDNTVNQVLFTIDSVNEEMGGMFYKDQMLYVDITGMQRQLNGAVALDKLNLPKVKFDNLNLAQEITLLINDAIKLVRSMSGEDEYGENAELFQLFLDNLVSNEETNTMSLTITKELIEKLYGEDIDLVTLIADKLGVAPELVNQLLGDDALQNSRIVISYNVENGDIGVDLYDEDFLIFQLRLSKIEAQDSDTLIYPASFNTTTYNWLEIPDNTIVSINGTLSMQEVSRLKFDELFGALFGDITGINTPYTLLSNEQLEFFVDIMQVFSYTEDDSGELVRHTEKVMKIEIYKKDEEGKDVLQLGVYSSSDPGYVLVDFNFAIGPAGTDRDGVPYTQRALKYKISREKVKDCFDELLGEDNIFGMENIMDILSKLLRSIRDSKSMQLRFIDSSLAFNLISEPVKELIGIDHLNALVKARVRFATIEEEYLNINMLESQFVTPDIRPLENDNPDSIYTTQWREYVYTYFGNDVMRLKLTFDAASSTIISNKYYYQPKAKLLGEEVSYYVTIKDEINGIKIVSAVLDPETPKNRDAILSADKPLKIDPSQTDGLPVKIPVLYDDGTFGEVDYIIEGFDISNITIAGMEKEEFWLIIGKGSVAELKFYISVEVFSRVIIPLKEMINGEAVYMISDTGAPVVAEITVDPYTYAIKKSENQLWSPLPTSAALSFESLTGTTMGDSLVVNNLVWDFDYNLIQYNGGVYFTHAKYNRLDIALKINVKSKIVAYLRFVDAVNTDMPLDERPYTEAIGSYTVDVLETESYIFPTTTTEKQELRLYFEDGTYRVIGSKEHRLDDSSFYTNYLPLILEWKHAAVNPLSIRLEGTKAPLGVEDKNINTTTIGSNSFTIGMQEIALTINMPTRAKASIGNAGSIYAITGYATLEDDSYDFETPVRQMVTFSNASFTFVGELGSFFEFNPYNQKPLPESVYLDVEQGGENRIQRKGYTVQWVESDVIMPRYTYDNKGNIIATEYILRHVSTDEEELFVVGILGDGDFTIEVNMIVKNLDAIYQDITFEGLDTNVVEITVDPYKNYNLPSFYTLLLKNGSEILVDDVKWYIILQSGKEWMFQFDGRSFDWIYRYIEYIDQLANGESPSQSLEEIIPDGFSEPTEAELAYYKLLMEKGEIPMTDAFIFSHLGGSFTLTSYIEATESVIAQQVYLVIKVSPRTVLITDSDENYDYTLTDLYNTNTSAPTELYMLDTYQPESTAMLTRLESLLSKNNLYEDTIGKINLILNELKKEPENGTLDNIELYALCYDEYYYQTTLEDKTALTSYYDAVYAMNPDSEEEEIKYFALQRYIQAKNVEIDSVKAGIYFGDVAETSSTKYELSVKWINLEEIIETLKGSDGAMVPGIVLIGYIGYGQINEQRICVAFKITRREIENFNFNRLINYDTSVFSIDYRYVYISDSEEAVALINTVMANVLANSNIPQDQKSYTIYNSVYDYMTTTDEDRAIMDEIEASITGEDLEARYSLIIDELLRIRAENIRTIFIEMYKPMGLTQLDSEGREVFIAPSEYFYNILSQVSLMFADGTEGYYSPRFVIGNGTKLAEQKDNFDSRLLATDPAVFYVETDPVTGERYAYVDVILTHLSSGSCEYSVTVSFKAIVDEKGVVDGYPSESELEPFDENGVARFTQGYELPDTIIVAYDKSGTVTFGNINSWIVISTIYDLLEGTSLNKIPVKSINVLNPSTIDLKIDLPCEQGEYSYHILFPTKYVGKVNYNAVAENRDYSALDITSGVITIDNVYEIYDGSTLGFNTSNLPTTINPYQYEYGVFVNGDISIDTSFSLTSNNSYKVQWRLADEWVNGRKVNHEGTDGNVLFATAKIPSYYYYESNESTRAIALEQVIELYINIKPLSNPVIEYEYPGETGEYLVDFQNNNAITFDPYDDSYGYGGTLKLPKDGLTVYFNGNIGDKYTFDASDELKYNLFMGDSDDSVKELIYNILLTRSQTTNEEIINLYKAYLNKLVSTYSGSKNVTSDEAARALYASGYDSLFSNGGLSAAALMTQRQFLLNYSISVLNGYNINSLGAWQNLMTLNSTNESRADIVINYLREAVNFTDNEIREDLSVLVQSYQSLLNDTSDDTKLGLIEILTATFDEAKKAAVIGILEDKHLFTYEISTIRENLLQNNVYESEVTLNAEIFDELMLSVSVNAKLDILCSMIEEDTNVVYMANTTGTAIESVAHAYLYLEFVKGAQNRTVLLEELALAMARTIGDWDSGNNVTRQRLWSIYMDSAMERASYEEIIALIELYMSSSEDYTIDALKQIIIGRLINTYTNNTDKTRYLNTIITEAETTLATWQIKKAKAAVWEELSASFANTSVLTRILEGEENDSVSKINTTGNRALAYVRLKQSVYINRFIARIENIEATLTTDRAAVYNILYSDAATTLAEKVILTEIMVGARYSVTDSVEQNITSISYTQSGHSIIQIEDNILRLYLELPDGQELELTLEIYSREIKDVLVPNTITNIAEGTGGVVTTVKKIENIYYIDPYNSETFKLPSAAEFVFKSGSNLVLNINEWTEYDEEIFYTISGEYDTNKIYYFNKKETSYRGGSYVLTSYLTYGTGANVVRQPFKITVIVLNRSLREEYNDTYDFLNPISGRIIDIPASLTNDMFVDIDVYYSTVTDVYEGTAIVENKYYSNFGTPVVPQIDWSKTSYNSNGITDEDILVEGGFNKSVQGYLYYDNNLLTNTYYELWQSIYDEYAAVTKPIAWERFFETMLNGVRIVRTTFSGTAAEQMKLLDDQIYDSMYISAYKEVYENANNQIKENIDNLMITLRNNYYGGDIGDDSEEWFILLYSDLEVKAKAGSLSEMEKEIWDLLYSTYIDEELNTIKLRRKEKWDALFSMTDIWEAGQQEIALSYLSDAYITYRKTMLVSTWEELQSITRREEAVIMEQLITSLAGVYGSTEQAKINAWDIFKNIDSVKGIWGESANVNITAKNWKFLNLVNINDNIVTEIIFNAFTKVTNENSFYVSFETLNTIIIDKLNALFEETKEAYYDEYRTEALEILKDTLMEQVLEEINSIISSNGGQSGDALRIANWDDLYAVRVYEATSPVDETRAAVEAEGTTEVNARDAIVWQRLLEGAGDYQGEMQTIYNNLPASEERYHLAVEEYRELRIADFTEEMDNLYDEQYIILSAGSWDVLYANPTSYGTTRTKLDNILYKDIKREAWECLYDNYSSGYKSAMPGYINTNLNGIFAYSVAWDEYYSDMSGNSSRQLLMDKLLEYYKIKSQTLLFIDVYSIIRNKPSLIGETEESLVELEALVREQKGNYINSLTMEMMEEGSGEELIIVEIMDRLESYKGSVITDLCSKYFQIFEITAWNITKQVHTDPAQLDGILTVDMVKAASWNAIVELRSSEAEAEYAEMQNYFDTIAEEMLNEQYAKAYDEIYYANINERTVLLICRSEVNTYDARTILWDTLYLESSEEEKTSMDSTLNIIIFESGELNAKAIAWDRLINKNETSEARKALMNEMYNTYIKARAFESYRLKKHDESTEYEDNLHEIYVKGSAWSHIYSQAEATNNAGRISIMDFILSNIINNNPEETDQEKLKAVALEEFLLDESVSAEEAAEIRTIIEEMDVEFTDQEKINTLKAAEWDSYYSEAEGIYKTEMERIIAKYSGIANINNRKTAALEDSEFINLIGATENAALLIRIEEGKRELLELSFMVKTYDGIISDASYTDMEGLYDEAYQRHLILECDGTVSLINNDKVKADTLQLLMEKHRKQTNGYFNNILSSQIDSENPGNVFVDEFNLYVWGSYFAKMEQENLGRAELMQTILEESIISVLDIIKCSALDSLYESLLSEATEKIDVISKELADTIKKEAIWTAHFGDNIFSWKSVINANLTLAINSLTDTGIEASAINHASSASVKAASWVYMLEKLSPSVSYKNTMDSVRAAVAENNPEYSNSQINIEAWQNVYGYGIPGLNAFMNETLALTGGDRNIAWTMLYTNISLDVNQYNLMLSAKEYITGNNGSATEEVLNRLSYDRITATDLALAGRLENEAMNVIKSVAWNNITAYYTSDALLSGMFEEMYNYEMLATGNDITQSRSICWNRVVGMVQTIDITFATVDLRFTEEELKAMAVDCILDSLNGTERISLQNAVDNINIDINSTEFRALVYDNLYQESIPEEKTKLAQFFDAANTGTDSGDKSSALNAYISYQQSIYTEDINNELSIEYSTINNARKLELYEDLYEAKAVDKFLVYTYDYAETVWNNRNIDTVYGRLNIFWDDEVLDEGGDIAKIYIGSGYKTYYDNTDTLINIDNTFVGENYLYKNRQIEIEKLDFYGTLNVMAGEEITGTVNYYNELVIDPLYPVVPTEVDAYGFIVGVTPDIDIGGVMYSYIGKVQISFEERINEFLYDEEGTTGENITATVTPGLGNESQTLTVKVYYLNREPVMFYTNSQNYTVEAIDDEMSLYPLTLDGNTGKNIITIDPLNENIYDKGNGSYLMPNSLVAIFTNAYADGIISSLFINDIFSDRLDISSVQWDLLGNSISLAGFDAANISISKYVVNDTSMTSTSAMDANFWGIQLEVKERNIERILGVNIQGLGGTILSSELNGSQKASKKIDPYNVEASFPAHIKVEFEGGGDSKLLTNITWLFAEGRGLDYLKLPEVITGTIDESAMYITAGFTCVSETIWINFPIQERHIDITVEGTEEIRYLEGGTIYLIKGVDLMTQLNKYSSLFYNFAEYDEVADWSEVPLEFITNDVSQISTAETGSYRVKGRLGPINDANIIFDIVVIDPKLFATDNSGIINSKVYYDTLTVATNIYGVHIKGKEVEEGFLPENLVQPRVADENGNTVVGYNEFEIVDTYWDIANKKVIFSCLYIFLDESDDIERLGGDIRGGQELSFTVSIPLNTYIYTEIDDSMVFDVGNNDGTNIKKLALGAALKVSDLPMAVMNKGSENEFSVPLLWDLSVININKAGTYNLYGYYRDYTSSYTAKNKHLVVVIDQIDMSDKITTKYSLSQTYTGLNIVVVPELPDVLRMEGSYDQLVIGNEIKVEYLTEEKYLRQDFGDFRTKPYKDSGTYYVRITINDYNITGQQIFRLVINPIIIDPDDITFEYGEGSSSVYVNIPNWPQTEKEKSRLYYEQYKILANERIGGDIALQAKASAYNTLFAAVNSIAQEILIDRMNALLAQIYPDYEEAEEAAKADMLMRVRALVWEEIIPYGLEGRDLVPNWPKSAEEKLEYIDEAEYMLEAEGETYYDDMIKAVAYDNLLADVINMAKTLMENRLSYIIQLRYPNYETATEAEKTTMLIAAKAIVWDDIGYTSIAGVSLIENWPTTEELNKQLLDAEYTAIVTQYYSEEDLALFMQAAKALAFDGLMNSVYSSAQEKLQASLDRILQLNYPLYEEYDTTTKALILTEAKSLTWDALVVADTVEEESYVYDGEDHQPDVSGMPQAEIIGWPQTSDEKTALLESAVNDGETIASITAKARAYDNLVEEIYSNTYALQKITDYLNESLSPLYYNSDTSYEERQALLLAAKAYVWDTKIIPGDTVEEVYYTFTYWYADMENNGSSVTSRPNAAGTYEITLIINPALNKNYRLKEGAELVTTISIRKAVINTSFNITPTYTGTVQSPICDAIYDSENERLYDGVSIDFTYIQDGREVNYIKDVGEYTFSAVVNGGNNYPSWTVESMIINILPKDLTINIGTVESGYLETIKESNSGVTFDGIVGQDNKAMFGYIVCESEVSDKHMVGDYEINLVGFKKTYTETKIYYLNAPLEADDVIQINKVYSNYNVTVVNGVYRIKKADENAVIIASQEELDTNYAALTEGSSVIWYLAAGNYDTLVLDKNVSLTIIGCYNTAFAYSDFSSLTDSHEITMSEVKEDALSIITVFESIVVEKGILNLDIIKIGGRVNESAVYIGEKATSVELKRCLFIHIEVFDGESSMPQNSKAIMSSPSFKGNLRLERTYIDGFTAAIYMNNVNELDIIDCRLNKNNAGLISFAGVVSIDGSRFEFTRGNGIYLTLTEFAITNCTFVSNEVGIRSLKAITYDLTFENVFTNNVKDIAGI